ncbi:hypothetical protein IHV67_25765, partial [Escherichia coli]|nr:hypothetical protein [Escherichia coli]
MGSCAAPSAKGDDKFITTDYLQQCRFDCVARPWLTEAGSRSARGIWEIEFNHKLLRYIYGLTNQFTT